MVLQYLPQLHPSDDSKKYPFSDYAAAVQNIMNIWSFHDTD
jgi:hypothetical protein